MSTENNAKIALAVLIVIIVAHLIAKSQGLYNGYFITDILIHTLAGIMFGFLWFHLVRKEVIGVPILIITTLSFATLGSFLWEIWELGFYTFTPSLIRSYQLSVQDILGDIFCGLTGGAISFLVRDARYRKLQ